MVIHPGCGSYVICLSRALQALAGYDKSRNYLNLGA